jgi:hypothetical protein
MRPILPRGFFWRLLSLALAASCFAPACLAQTSLRLGDMQADEERFEQALARRGSLEVVEAPLKDVVEKLSSQFQVPIVLKAKKLEEAGVNVDTHVTWLLASMPLESILDLMLDELDLDFTVRNHVILITTPEDLESPDMMDNRIYPVRDLVLYRVPGTKDDPHRYAADYDSLIDLITTTVEPEAWVDVGGPGSIKEFDNAGALVISQTRRVHREIAQLLATLRRVKELQGIDALPAPKAISSRIAGRTNPPAAARPPRRVASPPTQTWQMPQVYSE